MGWIDSPGAWSLLFNHNPAVAQTSRENVPAPAPTTAPQTSRGDPCGEVHACVYPVTISQVALQGCNFLHTEKETMVLTRGETNWSETCTLQWPLTKHKPERRRTQGVHISGITS